MKKSEIIGGLLLNVDKKKFYNNILDFFYDKRVRVLSAIVLYSISILFVVENKELIFQPYVKLPDGTYLQGSCDFIKDEYKKYRSVVSDINNNNYLSPDEIGKILSKEKSIEVLDDVDLTYNASLNIPICPPQANITEVIVEKIYINQTVYTDKECVCPSCPEVTGKLTDKQNDWLLNDCQIKDGAPCFQSGSADTCDNVREYFDVPNRPKFKTRPGAAFYSGYTQAPMDTVNFKLIEPGREDKGFYLNNSIWLFSGNGSMIWVHKK